MTYFLAKTDPDTYSIGQFEREKQTLWDGVTHPQAVKTIREMSPGDRVFVYHSGGLSAVVGMAHVLTAGRPDPKNPKSAVVDLRFARLYRGKERNSVRGGEDRRTFGREGSIDGAQIGRRSGAWRR